jgi:protease IV
MTDEEKHLFQNKIDALQSIFLKSVAENRNLSEDKIKKISEGDFFIGDEALQLGLIDKIGSKEDAIKFAEQKINQTAKIVDYKEKPGFLSSLFEAMSRQSFSLGQGIGYAITDSSLSQSPGIRT